MIYVALKILVLSHLRFMSNKVYCVLIFVLSLNSLLFSCLHITQTINTFLNDK